MCIHAQIRVTQQVTTAADKLLAAGYHAVFSDRKEAMFAKMNPTVRARIEREREAVAAGVSGGGTSQDIGGGAKAEGGGVEGRGGAGRMWEYRLEVDEAAIPSVEIASMSVSIRACVRVCVCARARACVRACMCLSCSKHACWTQLHKGTHARALTHTHKHKACTVMH